MSNRLERAVRAVVGGTARDSPTNAADNTMLTLSSSSGWPLGGATEAGAMKLSAVNRCQVILSESVGKLPIYCTDDVTHKRLRHELLYLLNVRPNEAMSPSIAKQMVENNRLSGGNGYEWIVRSPRTGKPVELIPLPWELVHPWRDTHGLVWYGVVHPWTGEPMVLPSEDVIHVKAYTHDGLHGISVLRRASEVIAAGRATQQYELTYFSNGGHPSGVLTTETDLSGKIVRTKKDGTTETVTRRDVVREEWERVHAGPGNAHRTAVLDFSMKYQPITMSNADAQFVESKAVTVEDIARFYGVPLSKLYAGKQAYNSNEQNAIDYVVSTLHPIVTQYDEELSYKLLLDSELLTGIKLCFNLLAELKGDTASRGSWYKAMREVGAFSADDIRDLEDMPSIGEGGDIYYGNKQYAPLDQFRKISAAEGGTNE